MSQNFLLLKQAKIYQLTIFLVSKNVLPKKFQNIKFIVYERWILFLDFDYILKSTKCKYKHSEIYKYYIIQCNKI